MCKEKNYKITSSYQKLREKQQPYIKRVNVNVSKKIHKL